MNVAAYDRISAWIYSATPFAVFVIVILTGTSRNTLTAASREPRISVQH
jgi:hypothetical protein